MIEPDAEEEEPALKRRASRPMRIGAALTLVLVAWGTLWLARPRSAKVPSPPVDITPAASPLGDAPVQVGSVFLCTRGEQIRAYGTRYFPTNHPLLPPRTVVPARCFRTAAEAEAAGYTLALPPIDGALIAGIYLVPWGDEVERECVTAAIQLGFSVPCPSLLPWTGTDLSVDLCGVQKRIDLCTEQGAFTLDEQNFAVAIGHGFPFLPHLLIVALKRGDTTRDPEFERNLLCPDGKQVGTDSIAVQSSDMHLPAVYIDCPLGPPPMAGHLILRWNDDGVVYEVSLHGPELANRLLLKTIVAHVVLIGPPP
jgi:hypothetical protein